MPRIRIIAGPDAGTKCDLKLAKSPDITSKEDSIVIGRDLTNSMPIADHGASRKHAEIFRIGDKYFLQDLQSRNGTFVNEEQISLEILNAGDRIRIGQSEMVFEDVSDTESVAQAAAGNLGGATMVIDLKKLRKEHHAAGEKAVESDRLQTLYKTGKIISGEKNQRKLIQGVLKIAAETVDAEEAHLLMRTPGGKLTVVESILEKDKGTHISSAIAARVIDYAKAVLSSDATKDERFSHRKSVTDGRVRSIICAPLAAAGKVTGALYLASSKVEEGFSAENLEIIALIAIQLGLALQNLKATESRRELYFRTIHALSSAIALRDPTTLGHSERVAQYVGAICSELDLSVEERGRIRIAGILHNIGKIGATDAEIEATAGEDKTARKAQMRLAEKVLKEIGGLDFVLPGILHTYENYDGSGVPDGLKGEDIPLMARIVSVANHFDKLTAMTAKDAQPMLTKEAIAKLHEMAGIIVDPSIVSALEIAYKKGSLFQTQSTPA